MRETVEILNPSTPRIPVTAVLFDFDGTLSTLRHGWEGVMEPLMVELLGEGARDRVRAYIDESTGLQTIHQMKWLAGEVRALGGRAGDPWVYKAEYNRRLMETVASRRAILRRDPSRRDDFLIAGGVALLEALRSRGVELLVASGTDTADVEAEAGLLGLSGYFSKVAGAAAGSEDCSKEAVVRGLLSGGRDPRRLAVIGDGRVEIAVGRQHGARTLGVASDEANRRGVDPSKRARLVGAGADAVAGDFLDLDGVLGFLTGGA